MKSSSDFYDTSAILCHGSCATTFLEQLCGYSKKSSSDFYDTSAVLCHGSYVTTLLDSCVATLRNHAATSMIPVQYCVMVAMLLLC